MQSCNSKCKWCADNQWKFVKAREAQMRVPMKGETTSFAEAARTSVKPD